MNEYTLVTSVKKLQPLLESLLCADVVALDTETTGLDPRRNHLRLLQLATNDGCWIMDRYAVNLSRVLPYLSDKTIVMHNAQFDLQFLAAFGWEPTRVVCTQLASQVLYAGHWVAGEISKQTSLKECASRELGIELDKELQASDWGGELTPEMLAYAARDAAVLLSLWTALEQSLTKEGLRDVAELEFRTVRAVAWASFSGVGFDAQRWTTLCEEARREAEALVPQLEAHVPEIYRTRQRVPINWNSRKESLEATKAAGMCFVDTNNATLDCSPTYIAELILRWRRAFREADQQDLTRCSGVLDSLLPPDYLASREPAINWHSTQQKAAILAELGARLPRTPKGSPRVDDDTLAGIDHPLAALLRKYSDACKRAERIGWLDFVEGGRIYPSWWQCGTETGRMSASKPPMQQVNRTAGHRSCFVAPPGRVLVRADFSQIELRCAAVISGDEAMLEAYRNGEDLHTATARTMLGRDFVDESEKKIARQLAKACNFGLLFGMGARKLGLYARTNYGVEMSDDEAAYYRRVFFDTYRGLRRWQRRAGDDGSYAAFTRSGRRRVLVRRTEDESFFTRRLNTPVQGTAGDGLKAAAALLYERRAECPDAVLVLFVHDELVLECDENTREVTEAWLRQAMIDGMQPLIDSVEVVVDTSWGYDWSCRKER